MCVYVATYTHPHIYINCLPSVVFLVVHVGRRLFSLLSQLQHQLVVVGLGLLQLTAQRHDFLVEVYVQCVCSMCVVYVRVNMLNL
jgi:hypothetical protein